MGNGKCRATTQWAMVLLMGVGQVFAIGNDRYWWATIGNLGQWCYDRLLSWLFSRAVGRRRVPRDICSITNYRVRWIIPQMQRTVQPLRFAVPSAEAVQVMTSLHCVFSNVFSIQSSVQPLCFAVCSAEGGGVAVQVMKRCGPQVGSRRQVSSQILWSCSEIFFVIDYLETVKK